MNDPQHIVVEFLLTSRRDAAARQLGNTTPLVLLVVVIALAIGDAGCSRVRKSEPARPPQERRPPVAVSESAPPKKPPATPTLPPKRAPPPKPPAAAVLPERPVPKGQPAPTAQCGHAVAFAGWRPDRTGVRDVLLVCDPGDNVIEEVGHAWDARPKELPLHYGRQRPTIVLQPVGSFTVTGAVIVLPAAEGNRPPLMRESVAKALPDLSQDFSARWAGLCGPTAGADVLFAMHHHDGRVLPGFSRGPGEAADAGVVRLIAGQPARIDHGSLAARMGVGETGEGATNEGIRRGLQSWLDDAKAPAWEVKLDWFDDKTNQRSREEQREFFGRLAAAAEAGGGGIICLWPGAEFADKAIAETPSSDPNENLPEVAFPELPPPPTRGNELPGRPDTLDPQKAASRAASKLAAARRQLSGGRPAEAGELAAEAVSLLHQASQRDDSLRTELAEALDLCRQCDAERTRGRSIDRSKPTEFQ